MIAIVIILCRSNALFCTTVLWGFHKRLEMETIYLDKMKTPNIQRDCNLIGFFGLQTHHRIDKTQKPSVTTACFEFVSLQSGSKEALMQQYDTAPF